MTRYAPLAAWGALVMSVITLVLVGTLVARDPARELGDLRDATREVTELLQGEASFGSSAQGGLIGDVDELSADLADLAARLGSLQDGVRDAANSSRLAIDEIGDLRSELSDVSARLSDICFRLGSC